MKGNAKVIEQLNIRLAEELTAINQYFVHAEMCENWKFGRISGIIKKRAITEMKHAEKLIERILFLEGQPIVSKLNKITIGGAVADMHKLDLGLEMGAERGYNETIKLAGEVQDAGTRDWLESILKDEEDHIDDLEAQLDQIKQVGIENYLADQIA